VLGKVSESLDKLSCIGVETLGQFDFKLLLPSGIEGRWSFNGIWISIDGNDGQVLFRFEARGAYSRPRLPILRNQLIGNGSMAWTAYHCNESDRCRTSQAQAAAPFLKYWKSCDRWSGYQGKAQKGLYEFVRKAKKDARAIVISRHLLIL